MTRKLWKIYVVDPKTEFVLVDGDIVIAKGEDGARLKFMLGVDCPAEIDKDNYEDYDWFFVQIGHLRDKES
jgi:hypothetical protein